MDGERGRDMKGKGKGSGAKEEEGVVLVRVNGVVVGAAAVGVEWGALRSGLGQG
jgi:hypothetical protein